MSSQHTSRIFIVGGTGAQGIPVVQALVKDKKYFCRVLSRDSTSARAKALLALGNVEIVEGSFANEASLRSGLRGCDGAFINIDGFNSGEKTEMYWAIRSYELAIEEGIKFFVYGNLDYALKKSGYDPRFRTGHYDGKGRIGEWILFQNQHNRGRMGAALFTTGPYNNYGSFNRRRCCNVESSTRRRSCHACRARRLRILPYVRWLFDHPERANGMDLEVAIADIPYAELAAAFQRVTGHPAQYIDTSLEDFWSSGSLKYAADTPVGYNAKADDPSTMTFRDNFTGFWNTWKYRIIKRDYQLLDDIHPNRIKSAEEWFKIEDKKGKDAGKGSLWDRVQKQNLTPILKLSEDGRKGKL